MLRQFYSHHHRLGILHWQCFVSSTLITIDLVYFIGNASSVLLSSPSTWYTSLAMLRQFYSHHHRLGILHWQCFVSSTLITIDLVYFIGNASSVLLSSPSTWYTSLAMLRQFYSHHHRLGILHWQCFVSSTLIKVTHMQLTGDKSSLCFGVKTGVVVYFSNCCNAMEQLNNR